MKTTIHSMVKRGFAATLSLGLSAALIGTAYAAPKSTSGGMFFRPQRPGPRLPLPHPPTHPGVRPPTNTAGKPAPAPRHGVKPPPATGTWGSGHSANPNGR